MKETKIENYNNTPDLIYGSYLTEYVSLKDTIDELNKSIKSLSDSFIEIGYYLKKIKDHSKFKELGYESIYEFAEKNYNFSKTTTKNFISVYERFGEINDFANPVIDEKYSDYNFSQLVELVSVKDDLNNFSPSQTVKEIRISKLSNNVDSDKNKAKEWFKNDLLSALKVKYKKCSFKFSDSYYYCIYLKYKKITLDISLVSDHIEIICYDWYSYESSECTFSFKQISKKVDEFIKFIDEKTSETKTTTTVTTKVETTSSSPISDQIEELDDYYEEELEEDHNAEDEEYEEVVVINQDDEYDEDEDFEVVKSGPTSDHLTKEEVVVEVVDKHIQKLKNNTMREEFIRNSDNYNLLYDLKEVNVRIFQHKEIPYIYEIKYFGKFYSYDKEDWIHAEYHLLDPNSTKTFGYAMFHNTAQSLSIIVNHLKEIKY